MDELDIDADRFPKELQAIERAVANSKACLDDFIESIAKYQPRLQAGSKGWASTIRKIQWVLCTKDDVQKFRAQVETQSSAVKMLAATLQVLVQLGL